MGRHGTSWSIMVAVWSGRTSRGSRGVSWCVVTRHGSVCQDEPHDEHPGPLGASLFAMVRHGSVCRISRGSRCVMVRHGSCFVKMSGSTVLTTTSNRRVHTPGVMGVARGRVDAIERRERRGEPVVLLRWRLRWLRRDALRTRRLSGARGGGSGGAAALVRLLAPCSCGVSRLARAASRVLRLLETPRRSPPAAAGLRRDEACTICA